MSIVSPDLAAPFHTCDTISQLTVFPPTDNMSAKSEMLSRPDDMSWRGPPQPTRSKFMRKAIENPLVPIGEWKHCTTMLFSVLPVLEHFKGGIFRLF